MKRVLIVSPRFVPTNAADMHRVRQSLPFLEEFGWSAVVLAVEPRWCEQPVDELLLKTIPETTPVHRVSALDQRKTKKLGVGDLGLRSYWSMKRAGDRLLESEPFDLVFFSTTAFGLLPLARTWRRRFGVPFVIDLQDPWLSDYYNRPGAPPPPGGRLKYGVVRAIARFQERETMRRVAHVVSVSATYPRTLMARYDWLSREQFTVLPFSAAEIDFDVLSEAGARQDVFDPSDGHEHWVYVGRAGGDMALALTALFSALAQARADHPERYGKVRLHFVGTTYATDHRAIETVSPIAVRCGVSDVVTEHPGRIPYFEALSCIKQAAALIVPGSDDPGYTASKLYPYILSARPMLAIFHENSSVVDVVRRCAAGVVVTFQSKEPIGVLSEKITSEWFQGGALLQPRTDWASFAAYGSREMTRRLVDAFDQALVQDGPATAGRLKPRG